MTPTPGPAPAAPAEPARPAPDPRFVLFVDRGGRSGPAALADRLAGRAWHALGWGDRESGTPYGPVPRLVATLAERLAAEAPEVVSRYGQTVRSLAPEAAEPLLDRVAPFRAQLLGSALRGSRHGLRDYFVGRNVRPRVLDDAVRFLLDAAAHPPAGETRPLLLAIDRVEECDEAAVQALCQLRRYAAGRDLEAVAVWTDGRGGDPAAPGRLAAAGWTVRELAAAEAAEDRALPAGDAARNAVAALAVLGGWRTAEEVAAACGRPAGEMADALEPLAGAAGRYAAPPALADAALAALAPEARRALHRAALGAGGTPFERARHAAAAGEPGAGDLALAALEGAWSVSAYDQALAHAEAAFRDPAVAARHDRRYLLGLLCYEARRFGECHEHLLAASEAEDDPEQRAILHRLIGYNGVFGTKRHDVALDYLDRARVHYEDRGGARDAAWIRNTMAFALMQTGRAGDAIALEQRTLREARELPYPDRFLLSILQLNLGRLHRGRSLDEALQYIQSAMADNRGDSGPYMLLLLYITLGNLYFAEGRWREAAGAYARCVDLSFDIDLAGFSDRTFPLLARVFAETVGPVSDTVALRGDVARLLCHFNLALCCRRAGLARAAERYGRWVRREIGRWGVPEYAAPLDAALAAPSAKTAAEAGRPAVAAGEFLDGYAGLFAHRPAPGGAEAGAAAADGLTVAFLAGTASGGTEVASYVLFDPRSAAARRRLDDELGRQDQAGGVLALREAAAWFDGADPGHPAVVQEVTLGRARRGQMRGLSPVRTRLRFVDGGDTPELEAAVRAFAARSGLPFVGAVSFRRAGEEIADTPTLAAKYFLETGIERLYLDGSLAEKARGSTDGGNLLPLRPRFSGYAAMPEQAPDREPAVVVSRNRFFRIGPSGTAVLSRCDGRRTVGELVGSAAGDAPEVCAFLLQMRRHGVIHFTHG